MDKIPDIPLDIGPSMAPTDAAYTPLLEANRAAIEATAARKQTHTYGSTPRHQLDLYLPEEDSKDAPVVLFYFGGGLIMGDRVNKRPTVPKGLLYANLAHFFTGHGFHFAVVDYRLVSLQQPKTGARYPDGAQDVQSSLEWVLEHYKDQGRRVFLIGNSGGGVHVSTFALNDEFTVARKKAMSADSTRLVGTVGIGVPWTYRVPATMPVQVLDIYYGSLNDAQEKEPLQAILKASSLESFPPMLVVKSTYEPSLIGEPFDIFKKDWEQRSKDKGWDARHITFTIAEGQNHLSPGLSPGTGVEREEKWAVQIVDWIKAH